MKTRKKKIDTNEELVREMMNFSNFGVMAQMFIIDAISEQSKAVASSKVEDYPENMFVSPEAWIGVAKEIEEKMEAFYNR